MKNILIILLTVLVVAAGAFLPELLLKRDSPMDLELDYQQVMISSESSSDYVFRMEQLADFYFGEGSHLLSNYLSEEVPDENGSEASAQFLTALETLCAGGVIPQNVLETVMKCTDSRIRYYYLFDTESVSGFRMAEYIASGRNWRVCLIMDVESGKLARVEYSGSQLIPDNNGYPDGFTSWYDVLRNYADYLGLSETMYMSEQTSPEGTARRYYDDRTADRLTARVSDGGTGWLELRVLRDNYQITAAVYHGGK